jgi:hypothetical protein
VASAVILTLDQASAVLAQCAVEFQKTNIINMLLGTCLDYDHQTKVFSHAHIGLQSDGKQKTVKSRQIRSKATLCSDSLMVDTKKFYLPPGTSGQLGLLKSPIKRPNHKTIKLTSINFTKSPCSKVLKYPRNCRLYATLILKGKKILNWLMYTSMAPMKKKD